MNSAGQNGTIVTFYSYKGGVGRSFALANIAATLAKWGFRVLCVDWDLEAPGLDYYLSSRKHGGKPQVGWAHVLQSLSTDRPIDWRDIRTPAEPASVVGDRLDILQCGSADPDYAEVVRSLNWNEMYEDFGFGEKIEEIKSDWRREYDFVLIDSRTGVTDSSGVCTIQMPDILCLVTTANRQSIDGARKVARSARARRRMMPIDADTLRVLPIISRFDAREEYDRATRWRSIFVKQFSEFYSEWGYDPESVNAAVEYTTIPYVSRWTFGEDLAVALEKSSGPESISYSLETISALIGARLEKADQLLGGRDSFVESVRRSGVRRRRDDFDVFLSYSHENAPLARQLADALSDFGVDVYRSASASIGRPIFHEIDEAIARSRNFVLLAGKDLTSSQEIEVMRFLRQTLDDRIDRTLIPVITNDGGVESFPSILRGYQTMSIGKGGDDLHRAAARIFRIIEKRSP